MWLVLSSIIFIIVIIYYKLNSSDPRALRGLHPQLFYGNLLQTGVVNGKNSLANALATFQRNYGDLFEFYYFSTRLIVFNTIEDVQEIYRHRHLLDRFELFYRNATTILPGSLLSIRNDNWKRHARIVEPLLKRSALAHYFDCIVKHTDELIDMWTNKLEKNTVQTDVINQCQQILLKMMLSMSYGNENNQHLVDAIAECNRCSSWSIFNGFNVQLIKFYTRFFNWNYRKARRNLRDLMKTSVDSDKSHRTLVQSLLQSSTLTFDEVVDEMLMINTGVDGVSTTLSWFIYYMSKYPSVQEKIKMEIKQHPATLTNEIIDQLQYMDIVIKEILRHSPVADISIRTIVQQSSDKQFQVHGIILHRGDSIAVAISNLHHDSRYWKIDPSLFYPERFLEDDREHSPYAYLPFGLGHYRACPGKYFALYQLKVICVRLMQMVTLTDAGDPNANDDVSAKGGSFVGLNHLTVRVQKDRENIS